MLKKNTGLILLLLYSSLLFANTEGTLLNGQVTIYYRTFGKGKPILIINGGPGMNSDGFTDLAKALSSNNQTIIYDQRGTGKSIVPHPDSTNITMDRMVQDMELLRTHLKIEKWVVLGHSFGGMLASYYASVYPQHIEALILSSSGGINLELLGNVSNSINEHLTPAERDSVDFWDQKINNGDTSYYARLQRGTYLAPAYLYNKKNVPIIARRLTQSNAEINGLVWDNMRLIHFDCTEKLSLFTQPVLILQGKQDILDVALAQKAHSVFKNSTLVLLDHCGHYGWLDRPELYLDAIARFLKTQQ